MWFIIILAVALIGANIMCAKIKDCESKILFCAMASAISILFGMVMVVKIYESSPQAIDVYRGKTELEITNETKNGVVVKTDSLVVFSDTKNCLK